MNIIDGKAVSTKIKENIKKEVEYNNYHIKLLVILVGDDPASKVYVKSKEKACKLCGIESETILLDANVDEDEIINVIEKANNDVNVNGILLQLPLPKGFDSQKIINKISPLKDVDGLNVFNQGKLFMGDKLITPCTPKGIIRLLEEYNVDIKGKNAVVIGRSLLVGKPASMLLLEKNATVTMAHSRTTNLTEICQNAYILVSAVGKPNFIKKEMVKNGAVLIDVGINRTDDGLVGDVDYNDVKDKVDLITPVPGGVGPMTIACLMENVLLCYKLQKGIEK